MEMTQRKQKILAAVVESYIRTGEPVGDTETKRNVILRRS